MAGISIASISLSVTDGGEGEPVIIGESSRAYAGNLRNSVRATKRTFNFVSGFVSESTWDSVQAATASQAQVTCTGDILKGDSITAVVKVSAKRVPGMGDALWTITGSGEEV